MKSNVKWKEKKRVKGDIDETSRHYKFLWEEPLYYWRSGSKTTTQELRKETEVYVKSH